MIPPARLRYTRRTASPSARRPHRRNPRSAALKALLKVLLVLVAVASPAAAGVEPALSAELGSPLRLSANLGVWIGSTKDGPGMGRGFLLQVQPGIGGGALNVGFTPVALPGFGTQGVGVAVKARLLRSWGKPWAIEPNQTFAGLEFEAAWIVKVSLGVLQRVGSGPGKATVFTWSIGVGL
ncbi:MAG TPA: hypothetical protein VI669_09130 [Vicinamibacteria bacterium]